jgi:DNA-binding LytR/AlgR family response regulator
MTNALIAEDEPRLAEELRELLQSLWPELEIIAVAANGGDALAAIAEHEPDIAFLDIRMPGLSGLDVARHIAHDDSGTRVVFVTAYDEHAVAAFEARAVDYVLKPVKRERMVETIARLKQGAANKPAIDANLINALKQISAAEPRKYLRWLNCGQGNEIDVIAISEVLCFQARDKYTCVLTADKERYIRTPIKELLNDLDPDEFWQVHRASIVRVGAVERVLKDETGRTLVKLKLLKAAVAVSQAFAGRFRQM